MIPLVCGPLRLAPRIVAIVVATLLLAGCGTISRTPPVPTPADFQGIAGDIVQRGINVTTSSRATPAARTRTSARRRSPSTSSGLDQPTPVQVYVYIFRDRATYERLRTAVDACARSYVTDPQTYESVETSPFVIAGQGPWGPRSRTTSGQPSCEAAGTGD